MNDEAVTITVLQEQVRLLTEQNALQRSENQALKEMIAQRDQRIEALEHQVQHLIKQLCGPKSDRPDDAAQTLLEGILTSLQLASSPKPDPVEGTGKKGKRGLKPRRSRQSLAARMQGLPEVVQEIDLPDEEKFDSESGQPLKFIGWEEKRMLAEEPARLYQLVYRRAKYGLPNGILSEGPGVRTAPLPDNNPIERGLADVSVLSSIITDKYLQHLTLYRIQERYQRLGIWLGRSTLCGWITGCSEALTPLVDIMTQRIMESGRVGLDDTGVKMLQPEAKAGKAKGAHIWTYVGLLESAPYVVYDFTLSREKKGPLEFIPESYHGVLQGDAYSGHDELMNRPGITEVGCWDHARRYFVNASSQAPELCAEALAPIKLLYQIEATLANAPPEERRRERQRQSVPILERLKNWLEETKDEVLPKSLATQAIGYALNQWEALRSYVDYGDVPISNCASENALRGIAVGRKNWLFVGNEGGGKTAAILFSITMTCRKLNIDAQAYLLDVLARIGGHPMSRIDELLPDRWQAANPTTRLRKDRAAHNEASLAKVG